MFTKHASFRIFRPVFAVCGNWDLGYGRGKNAFKRIHCLQEVKRSRPFKKFYKPAKKNRNFDKKEDVEPKVYTKDVLRKVSNLLRYSTWECAQEELENLSVRWDSYIINQVLKSHPPMEKAWLFFNWASKLRGFKHDHFTYTTMLDIFGEAKRISSMNLVFQQMQEKGIRIDTVTYTSLIHWLSNDGDLDGSVKMWNEMRSKGCHPTVVSYTAYMKVLFNHNRVKDATEVYKEMIRDGCTPNCYTYTVLMEHLAISGKFNEAMEIFSKMQEAGVQPDKAACNILVEKCCSAGETRTLAKILKYMKENSLVLRKTVYIEAQKLLRNVGESDVLLRQVHPHFSAECPHEDSMHNIDNTTTETNSVEEALISDMLTKKKFVVVDYLLSEMMDRNFHLHSEIISMIMEVYSTHCRLGGALLAFKHSVKTGVLLKKTVYLSLIGLLIRTNSFPEVVEIVDEIHKAEYSLGTHLTALLIYRLGCVGKPVLAAKIFDLLPDDQKNTAAYTALISAYFSCGDSGKGLRTYEIMRTKGIPSALGTYNVLLSGLDRCGKVPELETYRKEKKSLQAATNFQHQLPEEEMICNLLFARIC
ncbi:hypothetical protein DCAR_0730160 [Daucus carota subsp. sativus]|uniref:Pentacotripeptide-repeat region of PRORP domain-containing protein n=1 Tax=Daucus carota subsp. sativus TaxID=79200 RepID=A0A161ZRN8_DAUCS|nr:PREDICTED: pentatricopeptide repeat-containing protein At2g01390-like [Daucus carota subsp. sativus]WOH10690.1 hypothetical protein DCAR_0730160 [Daucus carota subsp. sativus]